jgi:hypothetical protein
VYFGRDARDRDQVGNIDANTRAIFGRSYVAEPDVLVKELAGDEAIKGPIRCSSRSRTSRVWTTTPPCSTASSSTSLRNSAGADGERS